MKFWLLLILLAGCATVAGLIPNVPMPPAPPMMDSHDYWVAYRFDAPGESVAFGMMMSVTDIPPNYYDYCMLLTQLHQYCRVEGVVPRRGFPVDMR